MKIILMTKNEYPLIKSWVLYHGHVFGYKNLYIIDSSDESRSKNFLRSASEQLGVNVFISPKSNLNTIEGHLNKLMHSLRKTADYFIKLDTDEFLMMVSSGATTANSSDISGYASTNNNRNKSNEGATTSATTSATTPTKKEPLKLVFDRDRIQALLDSSVYNGSKYQAGYNVGAYHRQNCTADDDTPLYTEQFIAPRPDTGKVYFSPWSFQRVGLGAHEGDVIEPLFNNTEILRTDLTIVHYHFHCFPRMVALTRQAVISHKYMTGNEPIPMQIETLRNISAGFEQGYCGCSSCHKVFAYMQLLKDPKGEEKGYENGWMENADPNRKNVMVFPEFRQFLRKLHRESPFGLDLPTSLQKNTSTLVSRAV